MLNGQNSSWMCVNPIQDGLFWGMLTDGGWEWGKKALPPLNLLRISYNDETWHSYTLPKEDSKNI